MIQSFPVFHVSYECFILMKWNINSEKVSLVHPIISHYLFSLHRLRRYQHTASISLSLSVSYSDYDDDCIAPSYTPHSCRLNVMRNPRRNLMAWDIFFCNLSRTISQRYFASILLCARSVMSNTNKPASLYDFFFLLSNVEPSEQLTTAWKRKRMWRDENCLLVVCCTSSTWVDVQFLLSWELRRDRRGKKIIERVAGRI